MEQIGDKNQEKKKVTEIQIFPVPFALEDKKEKLTIITNTSSKPSKEELIDKAFKFHSEGNISEAIKYYQYFINQGFKDYRVFSNYGGILKNLGKLQDAELITRKAIALNPDFAIAYYNLGNILKDLGKLKDAELFTRKAIELNPDNANAHYNLGGLLRDLGKLKDAELSTRKAIELNPAHAKAHSNLGGILRDLGKLQDAEISYRKAIELNPQYAIAHSNLGGILQDLGKLQDAEISYRKAIELNPQFAIAHSNLGGILQDLGKLQEAEISCRKAIELKPDYADAHYNLGGILRDLGKLKDAEFSTRQAIKLNPQFAMAHSNLGTILKDLGKLKDAEFATRQAIKLNPQNAIAQSNLGRILKDLGKLKDAEFFTRKAIELNPQYAMAYFSLSTLKYSDKNKIWQNQLFSESILKNKSQEDQINIYFARANILHKEEKYKESSKYLTIANNLKLVLKPSIPDTLIKKSKVLLIESDKREINKKEQKNFPESIFIVGMARSGSTLLESILSMNTGVDDLGEINILEESFLAWKRIDEGLTLSELYFKKVNDYSNELKTTTNKWLYNYQYAGIISSEIKNAKIIHCYRNPLDNILSIYRSHIAQGSEYFSSLVDCANVYLNQEEVMSKYKNRFRSKIYDLDYDLLVSNPNQEIKSLISWLGWKWDDSYLTPHLNPRSVSTRSNVEVRSPINSKSIGGWKNYKDMLTPAINILTQTYRYRHLIS